MKKTLWRVVCLMTFSLLLLGGCDTTSQPSENKIDVRDQTSDGKSLTIGKMSISERAWLVVVKQDAKSKNDIYAAIAIRKGEQTNVTLRLKNPIRQTTQVNIIMYIDTNKNGRLDTEQDKVAQQVTITVKIHKAPPPNYNLIQAKDQRGDGQSITIDRVNLLQKGWLYIAKPNVQSPSDMYAIIALEKGQKID